eukprot:gene2007-2329_t
MIASHADPQSYTLRHNQDPSEKLTGAPDLVVEPSYESFQLLDLQQGSWSDDASEQEAVDADAVIAELEGWQGDPPPQASSSTQQQDHGLPLAEAVILYLQSWVASWNQAGVSDEAKAGCGSSDCGARASVSNNHLQLGMGDLQLAAPSEVIQAAATAAHMALEYNRESL